MLEAWLLDQPAMIYVRSSRSFVILNKHHEPIMELFDINEVIFFDKKLSSKGASLIGLANKNDNLKRHAPVTKLKAIKGKKA